MARNTRSGRGRWRALAAALLLALGLAGYGWWWLQHWAPDPGRFRMQGVEVGAGDGQVDWPALKAIGARFVWLDASVGASGIDPDFVRNLDDARTAGLLVGAVHRYDPCQPAERQAANFVTLVPRDPALLPPAIDLATLADNCPVHVSDGAVESELMTFINQIEMHTGKAAVLKLSPGFARRYGAVTRFDRKLWLSRTVLEPAYAGRRWALWTANPARSTEASENPLRWTVAQP